MNRIEKPQERTAHSLAEMVAEITNWLEDVGDNYYVDGDRIRSRRAPEWVEEFENILSFKYQDRSYDELKVRGMFNDYLNILKTIARRPKSPTHTEYLEAMIITIRMCPDNGSR
jgi:hypothetical protein